MLDTALLYTQFLRQKEFRAIDEPLLIARTELHAQWHILTISLLQALHALGLVHIATDLSAAWLSYPKSAQKRVIALLYNGKAIGFARTLAALGNGDSSAEDKLFTRANALYQTLRSFQGQAPSHEQLTEAAQIVRRSPRTLTITQTTALWMNTGYLPPSQFGDAFPSSVSYILYYINDAVFSEWLVMQPVRGYYNEAFHEHNAGE